MVNVRCRSGADAGQGHRRPPQSGQAVIDTGGDMTGFAGWVHRFQAAGEQRRAGGEPRWADGAELIGKAARTGDAAYLAAVRLFVAEERNHARLLRLLLAGAGAPTIGSHWSDAAFVRIRRTLGLRLELMTLQVAEVIALRYYAALRDGACCPLVTDVAGRILADEQRHVPFHAQRL